MSPRNRRARKKSGQGMPRTTTITFGMCYSTQEIDDLIVYLGDYPGYVCYTHMDKKMDRPCVFMQRFRPIGV